MTSCGACELSREPKSARPVLLSSAFLMSQPKFCAEPATNARKSSVTSHSTVPVCPSLTVTTLLGAARKGHWALLPMFHDGLQSGEELLRFVSLGQFQVARA